MYLSFGLFATNQTLIFQFLNVQRLGLSLLAVLTSHSKREKYVPPILYWQRPAIFLTFFIQFSRNLFYKKNLHISVKQSFKLQLQLRKSQTTLWTCIGGN